MSVTSVKVKALSGGSADYKGIVHYTAVFNVETNDTQDGILTVGTAVDPGGLAIPAPGISVYQFTPAETDLTAYCRTVTPSLVDGSLTFWEVTAEYSNELEPNQDNPLLRPTEINVVSQKYEMPVIQDINGQAIVNKAGNPFDPPLMMDGTRWILTLKKNFEFYNFDLAQSYADHRNATLFYGYAAGKLKLDGFQATRMFEQDMLYWAITAEFAFRREGWQLQPLNAGMYVKSDGTHKQSPCKDADGNPVSAPVPLDSSGAQITNPTVSNVIYLAFDVYPTAEFNLLGF